MISLIEFLNPVSFWKALRRVAIDSKNRNYYVKQMRTLEKNGTLKQIGMRLDMRSRAYYILNLEPETLMMGSEVLELERSRVLESINLRKPTFEKADLIELIEIETARIKNEEYYAYLIQIKYRPSSTIWDKAHILCWLTLFISAFFAVSNNWGTLLSLSNKYTKSL